MGWPENKFCSFRPGNPGLDKDKQTLKLKKAVIGAESGGANPGSQLLTQLRQEDGECEPAWVTQGPPTL